jgi:hypothetical protein
VTVGAACEHSFVNAFRLDAADRSRRGPTRILHADLDAFFASVEQRDDPSLRGRPIAVGGGVVLAASYEARAFGVRGAMGGTEARRRCPDLRFVRPRMSAYSEASAAVFEIFRETSPIVEGISIDEAFLDVSGLRRLAGEPADIATRLRARVRAEVGLPISVGIASTKALAKVASAVGKPDGLCEGAGRWRARLSAPAADRAALGRWARQLGEAARTRHSNGRRARSSAAHGCRLDRRARIRRAPVRARGQRGPSPRSDARPPSFDGCSARTRPSAAHRGGARRRARRTRGAGDGAYAFGRSGRPVHHVARPVRRLHRRHPVGHAAGGDGAHPRRSSRGCAAPTGTRRR